MKHLHNFCISSSNSRLFSEEVVSKKHHLYQHQSEGQELTGQDEYPCLGAKDPSGNSAPLSLNPLSWQWEEVETRRALRKGIMGRGNLILFYVSLVENVITRTICWNIDYSAMCFTYIISFNPIQDKISPSYSHIWKELGGKLLRSGEQGPKQGSGWFSQFSVLTPTTCPTY